MQVKKYEAPTIQEALEAIKRELGPEAIILQTKNHKKGFGLLSKSSVEVTAAIAERSLNKKKTLEKRLPEFNKGTVEKLPANRQADIYDSYSEALLKEVSATRRDRVEISAPKRNAAQPAPASPRPKPAPRASGQITARRYADIQDGETGIERVTIAIEHENDFEHNVNKLQESSGLVTKLQDEIQGLKKIIEELRHEQNQQLSSLQPGSQNPAEQFKSPTLHEAFEMLITNGIERRYAVELMRTLEEKIPTEDLLNAERVLEQLAQEIMDRVEVVSLLDGIGPKAEGASPTVIALVGPSGVGKTTTLEKIASRGRLVNQLKIGIISLVPRSSSLSTFCKLIDSPFRECDSAESYMTAIRELGTMDLILVDTPTPNYRDQDALWKMHQLLQSYPQIRTHLVLAATTRDIELYDMGARFSLFRPESVSLTKIDESIVHGCIFNLVQRFKIPIAYFGKGQSIPDDGEAATKERVATLVLNL